MTATVDNRHYRHILVRYEVIVTFIYSEQVALGLLIIAKLQALLVSFLFRLPFVDLTPARITEKS